MKKIFLATGAALGIFAVSLGNSKPAHISYPKYTSTDTVPSDTTKKFISAVPYSITDTVPADTTKHK